ncbi:hypothetical protein VNI00_005810 [Paramarasmius palmivorus]|uniref:UFSP1/2/DUB catalytic domain-containing protein n=1 Tax=Paramarasmius palmivorus TaxID=297713 RepID=A0AAW0DEU8_9AGAR
MNCQICYKNLSHLSVENRQLHYDEHFNEGGASTSSNNHSRTSLKPKPTEGNSKLKTNLKSGASWSWRKKGKWKQPFQSREDNRDTFWYPAMDDKPNPSNFIPGMITLLKKALIKSHSQGITTRAVLCYERTVYIHRQSWDAYWGCGYRNFLMACAALMDQPYQPLYFPLLDEPISPGIRNLQKWIEEAWQNGFDEEGYQDLRRLVDTEKWIGTSGRAATYISYMLAKDIRPLTQWIVQYFDKYSKSNTKNTFNSVLFGATPVQCVPCMPLILQNDGHSRLVVGYEMVKGGAVHFLVFDPSRFVLHSAVRIKTNLNRVPTKDIRKAAFACYSRSQTNERNLKTRSNSPGQKRRSTDDDIIFLGDKDPNKRLKSDSPTYVRGGDESVTIVIDDDEREDEVEIVDEKPSVTTSEKEKVKAMIMPESVSAESLWKDMVKLCRWEDKKARQVFVSIFFFRSADNPNRKNKKYQILYFPMDEPLTERQKTQRKVLTSEKIS